MDSTHDDILKSPSASTSPAEPQPAKKISLKRNISVAVPVVETKTEEESLTVPKGEPDAKIIKMSELTAKERLELRAKKFAGGDSAVPTVASDDRLQARAARFGITAPEAKPAGSVSPGKSAASLELLKKRAERFGTVLVPELKKSEMEEKLQKRQERFGGAGKVTVPLTAAAKSEYEEKALKRLERFKQAA